MNICKFLLGKNIEEISFDDVEIFFQEEQEESDNIEFKSLIDNVDNLKEISSILKSICAFLNSNGGIIIWGAPVGIKSESSMLKTFKGNLTPTSIKIDKDRFINKVSDQITPTPPIIIFKQLERSGKRIFLVEVAKSDYSPHQFQDKYYMRLDGQSRPTPHHYIEALFKKISYPKLRGFIIPTDYYEYKGNIRIKFKTIILNLSKLENEYNLCLRISTSLGGFLQTRKLEVYSKSNNELILDNACEILFYNQPFLSNDEIEINPMQLANNKGEVDIILSFGGKKSPLLFSHYKIIFEKRGYDTFHLSNPNLIKKENNYLHEFSDTLGISEEERIKSLINRLAN